MARKEKNPFSFQGFDATSELLRGPVRPKKNPYGQKLGKQGGGRGGFMGGAVAAFMGRAGRVARKSPEVMVKITGGAKDPSHLEKHLTYITRNGQLEATNARGETITGRSTVGDLAKEWAAERPRAGGKRYPAPPDTRNIVLSMPEGTDPSRLLRAAKTFADKTFGGERDYVLVMHTKDTDPNRRTKQPHVHLSVKTRGFDGRNLHPRKADLQAWREGFAHELRELGIAAEATPRRARGVVKKPKKQAVFHMEREQAAGKKRKDGSSRAPARQLAKYAEAVKELTGIAPAKARPWEFKIAERQKKIRGAWLATAGVLDKHPSSDAKALASQIRQFVADMPPVETERQQIQRNIAKQLQRDRSR